MTIEATATARDVPTKRLARRGWRARDWRFASTALILGLMGVNAWWLIRDALPAPDLKTINRQIARREFVEAEAALREFLRRSPHHGEARMALARVLYVQGDRAGCAEQLHRVPVWWPSKGEARFSEGKAERDLNRGRRAEAAWRAGAREDPLRPIRMYYIQGAVEGLMDILGAEGRWDEARCVLWELYAQVEPIDRAKVLDKWAQTQILRIDPKDSAAVVRRFLAADPDDWQAARALARLEQTLGHEREADRLIATVLAARPRDPRVWRDWLEILAARGNRVAVSQAFVRLPAEASHDPTLAGFRAWAREEAGDLKGTADAYRESLRWWPFDEERLYRLSLIERRLGQARDADQHLRQSKALRAARSELPAAAQAFREAVNGTARAGAPDRSAAASRLAELCETLGWPQAAEAWAQLARGQP
jgi:tetratricopeptide (TPR) repeat protein